MQSDSKQPKSKTITECGLIFSVFSAGFILVLNLLGFNIIDNFALHLQQKPISPSLSSDPFGNPMDTAAIISDDTNSLTFNMASLKVIPASDRKSNESFNSRANPPKSETEI